VQIGWADENAVYTVDRANAFDMPEGVFRFNLNEHA
jgi:hypothetical protein